MKINLFNPITIKPVIYSDLRTLKTSPFFSCFHTFFRANVFFLIALIFTSFFAPLASQSNAVQGITVLSPADPLMERGRMLFSQQQYAHALVSFSEVVQNFPTDLQKDEALFLIAECYRFLNRDTDALQAYQFLESSNPASLFQNQINLQLGLLLGKLDRYSEALPYLQKAFQNASPEQKPILRYSLGLTLLRLQQWDQALPLLKESTASSNPPSIASQASWALADAFEKKAQFSEALVYWKKTTDLTSDSNLKAQALARSGWILLQQKKPQEAQPLFEKVRDHQKSGDWRTLANTALIQIAYEQEQFEKVTRLFKEERQSFLDLRRAEIFFMAGLSHHRLKNHEQANQILTLFLKNFPDHPQATVAAYTKLLSSIQVDPKGVSSETAAFLSKYPQSQYANTIKLLRAQDFSSRKKFQESIPMWEELKSLKDLKIPRDQVLLERARAYYETKLWLKSADAFQDFLREFPKHDQSFQAKLSRAIALQQGQKNSIDAWEIVLEAAPKPSSSHQLAIEQSALLSTQNSLKPKIKIYFESLLKQYPESTLIPLAHFQLGLLAVEEGKRELALTHFDQSRQLDPKSWGLPATQRMVYLAYELKNPEKTLLFLQDYEKLFETNPKIDLMPAAIYYWLGEVDFNKKLYASAATFFAAVNSHPQPGELRNSAWWYLAESQRQTGLWKFAITSYERFQKLEPEKALSNEFILALAQAHLGAKNWKEAQTLSEKVMLQDPEGKSSAQARFLVAESYEGRNDFAAAAKAFAALAVLYQDPHWTPRAMHRASLAFAKINDKTNAQSWNEKLSKQYPEFRK